MSIIKPTDPPPLPPRKSTSSQQASPIARQVQTKAGLLAEIARKNRYAHIPLVGQIMSTFIRREVKANYVETLKKQFVEGAATAGLSAGKASTVFNHFIRPKLLQTHLEDLPKIEEFWTLPSGIKSFTDIIETFANDPIQGVRALTQRVDTAIWVMTHVEEVAFMMANRFTASDKTTYASSMLEMALSPNFNTVSKTIDAFLGESKRIQSERPQFYMSTEQETLMTHFLNHELTVIKHDFPFVEKVFNEICDMTVDTNNQSIQENLEMYYLPIKPTSRTNPDLRKRYPESSVTLSVEKHVPFQLLQDNNEVIDFEGVVDLYITNEKTMETRSLSVPLPFQGKMTSTAVRGQLALLRAAINGPEELNKKCKSLDLEPVPDRATFLKWATATSQQYGQLIFDFNPTVTRPTMSYALQTAESQAALQQPLDVTAAIQVAIGKNIYLVHGKLSLLPEPLASNHPEIATIAPLELKEASMLFLGKAEKKTVTVAMTPNRNAIVSLNVQQLGSKTNDQVVQVEVTFLEGQKTHTRKTTYLLEPNQKTEDRLQEIIASGLFERDLLLAKAEFMGEHGKL